MIKLLHVNDYVVDTKNFKPLLNDSIVEEFEQSIANFVGAKYAVSFNIFIVIGKGYNSIYT